MKQHLRFLFTLLLAIVCGGAMFGQTFKKVTSETELKAGDIIAIVNEANNVALSTNQKTNNRGQTSISISNGSFESTKDVQEITLEGKAGAWYFNVGNGYLYAASSSSNYLKTEPTKDSGGNSKASITFAKGQVTIKFLGKNTNNLMAYNKISSLFAVYSNNDQLPIQIYKKQVASGTKTTISFPKSSYTLNYAEGENGTYTISDNKAVLTPAGAGNVTYSVSSTVEGLAVEVEGEVMVDTKKVGTATVTASFAGNDTYAASSASYTITVQDNRTSPTLTFAKKSYTFNVGDKVEDFTNALTIDPAEAGTTGITYSSDKDWALVDENSGLVVVSTDAAGTATITASYAENDKYKSAKASYTIEVKKAAVVEDGVFDFTQSVNDYGSGVKASNNGSSFVDKSTWVAGNVTMTTSKGTGSGVRWWLNNDKTTELRVYKGSDFTISVGEGYFINSIKFDGVNTGLTARPGTMNNGTWSGKSQSVTFTASNARKDINSITVKYAKLETLTTAASGFATYAADYDVNYSALGLTTYAITLDEANNKVSYNRFEGVVPAGKAVLVQGTASTPYELTPAEGAADATFSTDLKASDGTVTAADNKIYAFGTLNGKSGFKLVNNGIKIPAKKGYLQLTGTTAAKPTFFAFDGIGTGISHIEADAALENAAMYNLAGQRVDKSYKGVVIVNGKKMLRK